MPPNQSFDKSNTKALAVDTQKLNLQVVNESADHHEEETSKGSLVSEKPVLKSAESSNTTKKSKSKKSLRLQSPLG